MHVDLINVVYWRRRRWIGAKINNYVIIAVVKRQPMGERINRIPDLCPLIASLQALALRTLASFAIQEAFSMPCPINLISKDTHLVFSVYCMWRMLKLFTLILLWCILGPRQGLVFVLICLSSVNGDATRADKRSIGTATQLGLINKPGTFPNTST